LPGLSANGITDLGLHGSWGHDQEHRYRPGTYIFETPTVIHRFVNGPSVTEAVFVSFGDLEFIDPETRSGQDRRAAGDARPLCRCQ
jgi:hypothetical protein